MDTPTLTVDPATIVQIPLDQLHDSPTNPRRTFLDIEELAADIRQHRRVLQPLLVRPRRPNPLRDDLVDGYEVVFGHRRKRGAVAAGLTSVDCMVREMTDEEVKRAQISENLQRRDVHPIEEAEGFQALMRDHGVTADELAEQAGKSKSYVYGRLKLLEAVPEIREACVKGEIGSEVALLIARLGPATVQQKALARIKAKYWDLGDGGKRNFRNIRDLLIEQFTLRLKDVIFAPEDATLLPSAGVCSACPKRSGNAPEYADTLKDSQTSWGTRRAAYGPDLCTDPACCAEKKKAHLRRQAEALQEQGKVVIEGNRARASIGKDGTVKGAYVALKDVKDQLKKAKKGKGVDAPAVETVLIQSPYDGKVVEAVAAASLKAADIEPPAKKKNSGYDWQEVNRQRQAEYAKKEERAAEELPKRFALLQSVRAAMAATERSEFDLRMVVRTAVKEAPTWNQTALLRLWNCEDVETLLESIEQASPQEMTQLLIDCTLVENVIVPAGCIDDEDEQPHQLLAAAKYYGVDIEAARAGQMLLVEEPTGEASEPNAPNDAVAAEERIEHTPEELAELQAQGWLTLDDADTPAVEPPAAAADGDAAEPASAPAPVVRAEPCIEDFDIVTQSMAGGILRRLLQEAAVELRLLHKATVLTLMSMGLVQGQDGRQSGTHVEITDAGRAWLAAQQERAAA
ncbi:ParB/RepB/Spo0J family partition protein [uncultured Azohydromonas sp.]|jgi:ParB-like partition proteins|uniref:ParB/RepB/Spo0J family partition protein n=1 Tax=uncultured Azohydromonas sp. TaxID=487342 RepID=UPI00261E75ED|nr:ParB/RepB/Spo0J family partition protein [uncultured Azohydromonas sp.]